MNPEETIASWAAAQTAYWRNRRLDRAALHEALLALNDALYHIFIFEIEGGRVRLLAKPQYSASETQAAENPLIERAQAYLKFFQMAANTLPPDTAMLLAMTMEDYTQRQFDLPIFAFQQRAGAHQLLVPDIDSLRSDFYDTFIDPAPYGEKLNQAIFVGSTTGGRHSTGSVAALSNQRLASGVFFANHPQVDFRLPNIVQCDAAEAEAAIRALGFGTGAMDWPAQLRSKFVLSMDGNGATCSRVALALASNSVLIKYRSPFELYYFPGLVPNLHYLDVRSDAEVLEIIQAERDNPGLFQMVARNGRYFFGQFLAARPAIAYTAQLLRQYDQLFDLPPDPTPQPVGIPLLATLHVAHTGDVRGNPASWLPHEGNSQPIEGFLLDPQPPLSPSDIQYRANGSGWCDGRTFAGTTARSIPLTSFAIRLAEPAARLYRCSINARFASGDVLNPADDGEQCSSPGGAALVGLRIELFHR